MGIWERRLFGVLALGGAFSGVMYILMTLSQDVHWFARLLQAPAFVFYLWGIVCGVKMLEAAPDAIEVNTWYWIVQIPCVVTPLIGGFLTSGASATIGLQSGESLLYWAFYVGSRYHLAVLGASPIIIAVNVLAVAAVVWLKHRDAQLADAGADEEPAVSGADAKSEPDAAAASTTVG